MSADAGKCDEFDWVPVRRECSAYEMLQRLNLLAKRDVEAMAVTRGERVWNPASMYPLGNSFVVSFDDGRRRASATIQLNGNAIEAERGSDPKLSATLTLNDDGECRLLVDGAELRPWQFLKRVLEPVFFGQGR